MGWSRQPPNPADEAREKRNVAIAVGACFVASGVAAIIDAATVQTTAWYLPLVAGGISLIVPGFYGMVFVPLLGAPFPAPGEGFILRPVWDRLPFSAAGRKRAAEGRYRRADDRLRDYLRKHAKSEGFDARRAVDTLLEETISPHLGSRAIWIYEGMIGYGPSGNIALTTATAEDAPEVQDLIRRFEDTAALARKSPLFLDRQRAKEELDALG